MIFRRLISRQCFPLLRNYCQKEKADICPPNVYCRKGDQGEAYTMSGDIHPKDHDIFHALGTAEELLCYLGIAKEHAREANHQYCDKIKRIQTVIIEIWTGISQNKHDAQKNVSELHIRELEDWTRSYAKELPPPEQYIIPGGGVTSASLQLARTVCRRTERYVTPFVRRGQLNQHVQVYLNRLSDFLFMLSRMAAKLDKQNEHIYVPITNNKPQENKKSD